MNAFDAVDYAALVLALGGLAALVCEIAVRSPRSFLEIMTDARRFAEPKRRPGGATLHPLAASSPDGPRPAASAAPAADRPRAA